MPAAAPISNWCPLDRHLFTSTAHYRVTLQNLQAGAEKKDIELLFVDHIEHGPLPWSRLKALKLAPVMVNSNYELEKNDVTAKWFDAAKGAATAQGPGCPGLQPFGGRQYRTGTAGLHGRDANTSLKFSGLNLAVTASDQAAKIKLNGYMDDLKVSTVTPEQGAGAARTERPDPGQRPDQERPGFLPGAEHYRTERDQGGLRGQASGWSRSRASSRKTRRKRRAMCLPDVWAYNIASIDYNDKPVGSAQMSWTAKNLDFPAMQSLIKLYQVQLEALQKAQAAGAEDPEAAVPELTPAQQTQAEADIKQLLTGKPQIALENFSIKTANGESRASLVLDLTNPSSTELPPRGAGQATGFRNWMPRSRCPSR